MYAIEFSRPELDRDPLWVALVGGVGSSKVKMSRSKTLEKVEPTEDCEEGLGEEVIQKNWSLNAILESCNLEGFLNRLDPAGYLVIGVC